MKSLKTRQSPVRRTTEHPTRLALLEAIHALLLEHPPEAITIGMVLERSAVSRGSMYHHFEDFPDLVETALVQRFGRGVDSTIAALAASTETARTRAAVLEAIRRITAQSQQPERRAMRLERAKLIAYAGSNARLAAKLAAEQDRLTDALTALFRIAQAKQWMNDRFDPHAAAVLVQAYTLGRIVDDVVDRPVDPAAWNALIDTLVDRVFG